jgi:hypothetical protein
MAEISEYFSKIGERGGSAGRGASKRRGHEHYTKMVAARNKKREQKKLEKGGPNGQSDSRALHSSARKRMERC